MFKIFCFYDTKKNLFMFSFFLNNSALKYLAR